MKIYWSKWYALHEVDLSDPYYKDRVGVYVIAYWNGKDQQITVRIGQGVIWNRIKSHRENPSIREYGQIGTLYVTWAEIPTQDERNPVERYVLPTVF